MVGEFDPYALLQALEQQRVTYVVIGGLGRVLHGSGEVTDGLDIVPSTRDENLRRLGLALEDLNARRLDGKPPVLERDLVGRGVFELETDAGELKVVPQPAGTRGYGRRSGEACGRRSPLWTITRGCWPRSTASRTESRSLSCSG
jgi:hypothetical protein